MGRSGFRRIRGGCSRGRARGDRAGNHRSAVLRDQPALRSFGRAATGADAQSSQRRLGELELSGRTRPFSFGVQEHSAPSGKAWDDKARLVESLGYRALYLPDHFGEQLGPIAALMAAAAGTTTLRVGSLVFDNDYRHPVVLAKEVATLDLLSDGRFDLGLGAGWLATDYEQAGITYDGPGVRIDRMVEGLQIIKGLLAGGK